MPEVFNLGRSISTGEALGEALGTVSATFQGAQANKMAKERQATQQRRDVALAQASEMRIEDLQMERKARAARNQAEIENLGWKLRQFKTGGNDAITRTSRGEDPLGGPEYEKELQDIQRQAAALPPFQRDEFLAYSKVRIQGMAQERRYNDAVREIQRGAQPNPLTGEPLLTPEAAQKMLAALDDASMSDIGPDEILRHLREQQNAAADAIASQKIQQQTYQELDGMLGDENMRRFMGASEEEWARRSVSARRAIERYAYMGEKIDPVAAKAEVRSILAGQQGKSEADVLDAALKAAQKDPRFDLITSSDGIRSLVKEYSRLLMGPQGSAPAKGNPRELPQEQQDVWFERAQGIINRSVSEDWSVDRTNVEMDAFIEQTGYVPDKRQWTEMQFKANQEADPGILSQISDAFTQPGERLYRQTQDSKGSLRSEGARALADSRGSDTPEPHKKRDALFSSARSLGFKGKVTAARFRRWVDKQNATGKGSRWRRKVKEVQLELDAAAEKAKSDVTGAK